MRINYEEYEGRELPMGYGIAWRDWVRSEIVLYPMPFNLIVRATRTLYYWLRRGWRIDHEDELGRAYFKGKTSMLTKEELEKYVKAEAQRRIEATRIEPPQYVAGKIYELSQSNMNAMIAEINRLRDAVYEMGNLLEEDWFENWDEALRIGIEALK